jgi:hypothetical protein
VGGGAAAALGARRQRDRAEDGEGAQRLRAAERVAEHRDARERADERLEVDERARQLGGNARLRPGESQ